MRTTIKYLNGSYVDPFLLNGSAFTFQLTDGTVISFCMWASWVLNIFIDVNGPTGPNTYGRDIYWLQAPWDKALGRYEIHPMGDQHTGWVNIAATGMITNEFTNTCQTGGKTSDFRYKYSGSTCAYEIVKNKSKNGDVCLLSPAAASYDRYKNFEERGKIFKELAKKF